MLEKKTLYEEMEDLKKAIIKLIEPMIVWMVKILKKWGIE